MAKFIKGKFADGNTGWKAVKYPEGKQVGYSTHEIHYTDDGECIAEVVHGEANAELMADAPKLLKLLKTVYAAANLNIKLTAHNNKEVVELLRKHE